MHFENEHNVLRPIFRLLSAHWHITQENVQHAENMRFLKRMVNVRLTHGKRVNRVTHVLRTSSNVRITGVL